MPEQTLRLFAFVLTVFIAQAPEHCPTPEDVVRTVCEALKEGAAKHPGMRINRSLEPIDK